MENIQEVVNVLAECTPDEIRDLLVFIACKGKPRHACACPVANYINKFTGEIVIVSGLAISLPERSVWIETPANVRTFIKAFDNGHYPELDIRN